MREKSRALGRDIIGLNLPPKSGNSGIDTSCAILITGLNWFSFFNVQTKDVSIIRHLFSNIISILLSDIAEFTSQIVYILTDS